MKFSRIVGGLGVMSAGLLWSGAASAELFVYEFPVGEPINNGELTANFLMIKNYVGLSRIALGFDAALGSDATYATISGGNTNSIWTSDAGAIGGGSHNSILTDSVAGTIGGGANNVVDESCFNCTIGGGIDNMVANGASTVGGGNQNDADGAGATVAGGLLNQALNGWATVGGGNVNIASGQYATVPGGRTNTAAGTYSFAAGRRAKANAQGCFTWGDSTNSDVQCNTNNRWVARSVGGVFFYTNTALTTGASLGAGSGTWASLSDKNQKSDIAAVDPKLVLEKVRNLPVASWRYKSEESGALHMGPMAQDFHAAFGLGDSDKTITTVDADGVALAAIQGLDSVVRARLGELDALKLENHALRTQNEALATRLERIEMRLGGKLAVATSSMLGSPLAVLAGLLLAGAAFVAKRRKRAD